MSRGRIGIDIGGTFTDVVYGDGEGHVRHVKTLTTHDDITSGILTGLEMAGADIAGLRFFLHGTTVALNALLEGKTPPVGLITTAGFRDVLEIMRTNRPAMYDLQQEKPAPMVARRFRREISARTDATGSELAPVDASEVRAIADDFAAAGIQTVAVCLLHSYASAEHEHQVRAVLAEHRPELAVSVSSDLTREWREFERTSTTVINAATGPILSTYLGRLEALLADRGFGADLLIMQSSSGVMSADEARVRSAATLMSGPAGGVVGAEAVARSLGSDTSLVTLDIGGTSADVAIIDRGNAVHTLQTELGRWPVLMPMVDIQSIGAGGGSIARVDAHGGLHVGPESAGAAPGPACYGRGGVRATVTDANLVLGRIDGSGFLGGEFPLDVERARAAIRTDVAEPLGLTIEEAADGIITIIDSHMSRLLREVLVQRGYDPRAFALLAYGGGGALHACSVGREAGVRRVVVPPHPGTLSAYGIYRSDVRQDRQAMFVRAAIDVEPVELDGAFGALEAEARSAVHLGDGYRRDSIRTAALRYAGQEYTLDVDGDGCADAAEYVARFHAEHERLYGFARREVPVEFVKLALSHVARTGGDGRRDVPTAPDGYRGARSRTIWSDRRWVEIDAVERRDLSAGDELIGPCAIDEPGATTFVPPGWRALLDGEANLVVDCEEA